MSKHLRIVLIVLALAAAGVHVSALMEFPSTATEALIQDLTNKGAQFTEARKSEMRDELYAMFLLNRMADSFLAAAAFAVAISAYLGKLKTTWIAAAVYALVNTTFLLLAWGVFEHGLVNIWQAMFARVEVQLPKASMTDIVEHLARPFTFFLGLFAVAAICFVMIKSLMRGR